MADKKVNGQGAGGECGSNKVNLIEKYADCKSKVHISGDESRVELMGKVLEMDEEISTLLKELRSKDTEMRIMRSQLEVVKDDSQRKEDGLLVELDLMRNKNSVMSDLYEIVTDHAEAVEEELERRLSMVFDEDSSAILAPVDATQDQ